MTEQEETEGTAILLDPDSGTSQNEVSLSKNTSSDAGSLDKDVSFGPTAIPVGSKIVPTTTSSTIVEEYPLEGGYIPHLGYLGPLRKLALRNVKILNENDREHVEMMKTPVKELTESILRLASTNISDLVAISDSASDTWTLELENGIRLDYKNALYRVCGQKVPTSQLEIYNSSAPHKKIVLLQNNHGLYGNKGSDFRSISDLIKTKPKSKQQPRTTFISLEDFLHYKKEKTEHAPCPETPAVSPNSLFNSISHFFNRDDVILDYVTGELHLILSSNHSRKVGGCGDYGVRGKYNISGVEVNLELREGDLRIRFQSEAGYSSIHFINNQKHMF